MRGNDGRMWLIDHGICFHSEYKMRTVIWDYAGELLPDGLGTDLENLADEVRAGGVLAESLRHLLSEDEIGALRLRARNLVLSGCLPRPVQQHNYPWPQM